MLKIFGLRFTPLHPTLPGRAVASDAVSRREQPGRASETGGLAGVPGAMVPCTLHGAGPRHVGMSGTVKSEHGLMLQGSKWTRTNAINQEIGSRHVPCPGAFYL